MNKLMIVHDSEMDNFLYECYPETQNLLQQHGINTPIFRYIKMWLTRKKLVFTYEVKPISGLLVGGNPTYNYKLLYNIDIQKKGHEKLKEELFISPLPKYIQTIPIQFNVVDQYYMKHIKTIMPLYDEKGKIIGQILPTGSAIITDVEFIAEFLSKKIQPLSVGYKEDLK